MYALRKLIFIHKHMGMEGVLLEQCQFLDIIPMTMPQITQ